MSGGFDDELVSIVYRDLISCSLSFGLYIYTTRLGVYIRPDLHVLPEISRLGSISSIRTTGAQPTTDSSMYSHRFQREARE